MEGYMIKDAAKLLGVESHVLRYWEEELGVDIHRNAMGHRSYDDKDIKMFREIMELKNRGMQLKDIKAGIESRKNNHMEKNTGEQNIDKQTVDIAEIVLREDGDGKVVDFKTAQLQTVMNKIVANALRENKDIIAASIKSEITTDVMRQFDAVMRENEEKEEARFKSLDQTLRQMQKANEEVAATRVKRGLFWKKS